MRAAIALCGVVTACASSAAPEPKPSRRSCEADIATRAPDAERVDGFDIDGDGDEDLVFRSGHDLHGNSTFYFYRVDGACAVYLGAIEAFITNTPHCVAPPNGNVCRLVARLRMFHDDYQETFYEHRGAFVASGSGRYIPPPNRPRE